MIGVFPGAGKKLDRQSFFGPPLLCSASIQNHHTMKIVKLLPQTLEGEDWIEIRFKDDRVLDRHLRRLGGLRIQGNPPKACIKRTPDTLRSIFGHFRKIGCYVDYSLLKPGASTRVKTRSSSQSPELDPDGQAELQRFKRWLETRGLSSNTVGTYLSIVTFFLRYAKLKDRDRFDSGLIEAFIYDFVVKPKKSTSYQNQCISGIKKFLAFKNNRVDGLGLTRPRTVRKLPDILDPGEIKSLLEATDNLKHKTLLSLIYSGGLRIGEALKLRKEDIDTNRMLIHIREAKGKKDRYTLLSKSFLELLERYYGDYSPEEYIFEGQPSGMYTRSSAQKVLKRAIKKAGIDKRISLHSLRHSFATHLLENGTDIRYIQELLGHSSPKTTMIYTHVTVSSIKKIRNPFDEL